MVVDPRVADRLPVRKAEILSLGRGSSVGRWAGIGPYYAMFPLKFAFEVVANYSRPGDAVLDPFAGRASSIYAAAAQGRTGYGIEINPVGWLYGRVKLGPAAGPWVLRRVDQIGEIARGVRASRLDRMPDFFRYCYCDRVLKYLIAARENLDWETSVVDGTLMAVILVYLHGKVPDNLSNQMRQGKAMDPAYSVRWWTEQGMEWPPEVDPVKFLRSRVQWRYAKGLPTLSHGHVEWGDSTSTIRRVAGQRRRRGRRPFDLLFTSPPYFAVTNYFYDQWLRLWMLGAPEVPTRTGQPWEQRFEGKAEYRQLLSSVFSACAEALAPNAVVYVRTDARQFTFETTHDILLESFPGKRLIVLGRPYSKATQTALYGDKAQKPGERDIVLLPSVINRRPSS